ncbi:MAG: PAS domain S-box protein [Acidobacteria bacterium]|nr:PAS domain S-box protein [Acidobacteriota bacterium]
MIRLLLIENGRENALLVRREILKLSRSVEIVEVTSRSELKALGSCAVFDLVLANPAVAPTQVTDLVSRLSEELPDLPLILLSDERDVETSMRLMKFGARCVLNRARVPELAGTIKKELDKRDLRQRISAFNTALRSSELRFSASFLQSAVGIAHITPSLAFSQVNHSYAEMVGRDTVEIIGKSWAEVYPGEPDFGLAIDAIARGQLDAWEGERRLDLPDGSIRWFASSISPVRDDDGQILFYSEVMTDISERRESERRNLRATALSETILQSTLDGICAVDSAGKSIFMNSAAARALGSEDAEGVDFHTLVHPRCDDEGTCPLLRALHSRQIVRYRLTQFTRIDGQPFQAIFTSLPILGAESERWTVIVFSDVAEQKRLHRQIEQFGRLENLGLLTEKIAHEFNNVLMGILPFAEILMRNEEQDPGSKDATRFIHAAVERGHQITRQILQCVHPEEPVRKTIRACELIESVIAVLEPTLTPDIRLMFRYDQPDIDLSVDEKQLQQVLLNVMSNSTEAMPQGGRIEVRLTTAGSTDSLPEAHSYARSWVMISVTDTGTGMPRDVLARAFEPMFSTKRNATGLGLAVARQIVESHGGEIFAESRPGEGSTVYITLKPARKRFDVPVEAFDPDNRP